MTETYVFFLIHSLLLTTFGAAQQPCARRVFHCAEDGAAI